MRYLIIDGLVQETDVKIITIDGTFIRYLSYIDGDVVGQQAFWDGKDHRGRYVGSGVCLCMAYTKDGDTTVGKIAVIRKYDKAPGFILFSIFWVNGTKYLSYFL